MLLSSGWRRTWRIQGWLEKLLGIAAILPRKGLLAIAAVVEVALQTDGRPISAKTLATRLGLASSGTGAPIIDARRHPQGRSRPAWRL